MDVRGKSKSRLGRGATLSGFGVSALVFVLYLRTLAPTVLGFEPPVVFDSAMLQTEAYVLGVAHPTGYSTYLMLTHLFTYLPFGDVAYRVNLASAVFGALAVLIVYFAGLRISGRIPAAAIGALAFGLSATFWSQSVIAEVYSLNALFMAAVILVLLAWRESGREWLLLLACFLVGLSLTHHLTSALLIPAGIAFVYLSGTSTFSLRRLLPRGTVLFLIGLTPYLYFPVRAAMNAPLNETDPSTPGRFLLLISGGNFVFKGQDQDPTNRPETRITEAMFGRISDYLGYLSDQFPLVLVAVGLVGIFYLVSTDRAATVLLGVPLVGSLLHGLFYGYEDYFLFLIPAYLIFGLCISAGVSVVLSYVESHTTNVSRRWSRAVLALLSSLFVLLPLVGAAGTYSEQDRSDDLSGRETVEAVAEYAEPGSVVLHHRSALWYMVLVEGRRTDLTLVDPYRTSFARYTDIAWPDDLGPEASARRYGTDDPSGVKTARMVSKSRAVYILGRELNQEIVDESDFREAGFDVVPVDEGGELYELVPSK